MTATKVAALVCCAALVTSAGTALRETQTVSGHHTNRHAAHAVPAPAAPPAVERTSAHSRSASFTATRSATHRHHVRAAASAPPALTGQDDPYSTTAPAATGVNAALAQTGGVAADVPAGADAKPSSPSTQPAPTSSVPPASSTSQHSVIPLPVLPPDSGAQTPAPTGSAATATPSATATPGATASSEPAPSPSTGAKP